MTDRPRRAWRRCRGFCFGLRLSRALLRSARLASAARPFKSIAPAVERARTEKLVGRSPAATRLRRERFGRDPESEFRKRGGGFLPAEPGVRSCGIISAALARKCAQKSF
jgi:hypothetical protein